MNENTEQDKSKGWGGYTAVPGKSRTNICPPITRFELTHPCSWPLLLLGMNTHLANNKNKTFLFEIYSQLIPAMMQTDAKEQMQSLAKNFFQHIDANFSAFCTTRRLGIIIDRLPEKTEKEVSSIKGPKMGISQEILEKFLGKVAKEHSCSIEFLKQFLFDDGSYYHIKAFKVEQDLEQMLQAFVKHTLNNFSWPKSMQWLPNSNFSWIRPIDNILAMIDEKILPVTEEIWQSNNQTFVNGKIFRLEHAGQYKSLLTQQGVVLDKDQRIQLIQEHLQDELYDKQDDQLLEEIACSTEHPYPFFCSDEKIQSIINQLPALFVKTCVQEHQQAVCVYKKDRSLNNTQGEPAEPKSGMNQQEMESTQPYPAPEASPEEPTGKQYKELCWSAQGKADAPKHLQAEAEIETTENFTLSSRQSRQIEKFLLVAQKPATQRMKDDCLNVIKCRLEDTVFMFKADLSTDPQIWAEQLNQVNLYHGLGTMSQKQERIASLLEKYIPQQCVSELADSQEKENKNWQGNDREGWAENGLRQHTEGSPVKNARENTPRNNCAEDGSRRLNKELLKKAASVYKLDLCSKIVNEFPELHGHLGSYCHYANGIADILLTYKDCQPTYGMLTENSEACYRAAVSQAGLEEAPEVDRTAGKECNDKNTINDTLCDQRSGEDTGGKRSQVSDTSGLATCDKTECTGNHDGTHSTDAAEDLAEQSNGAGDLPGQAWHNPEGLFLGLLDRLDTLLLFFRANIKISSSADPFGLRRIATEIIEYGQKIVERGFLLEDMPELIKIVWLEQNQSPIDSSKLSEVLSFIIDRQKHMLPGVEFKTALELTEELGAVGSSGLGSKEKAALADEASNESLDSAQSLLTKKMAIHSFWKAAHKARELMKRQNLDFIRQVYKRLSNFIKNPHSTSAEQKTDAASEAVWEALAKLDKAAGYLDSLESLAHELNAFFDSNLVLEEAYLVERVRLLQLCKLAFDSYCRF